MYEVHKVLGFLPVVQGWAEAELCNKPRLGPSCGLAHPAFGDDDAMTNPVSSSSRGSATGRSDGRGLDHPWPIEAAICTHPSCTGHEQVVMVGECRCCLDNKRTAELESR